MLAERVEYIPHTPRYTVIEPFKKRRRSYARLKQKLSGIGLTVIGIIFPFILGGDATVSLLFIPMGIYLVCTKRKIMTWR